MRLVLFVLVLVAAACAGPSAERRATPLASETPASSTPVPEDGPLAGDYLWRSAEQSRLQSEPWRTVTIERTSGFTPVRAITERSEDMSDGSVCLRVEGGLAQVCHWLDVDGSDVRTQDTLASRFAPVETDREAVSFVAATQPELRAEGAEITARTLPEEGAWYVLVERANTYGCGAHEPSGVVFRVERAGRVEEVAAERRPTAAPGKPVLCVD